MPGVALAFTTFSREQHAPSFPNFVEVRQFQLILSCLSLEASAKLGIEPIAGQLCWTRAWRTWEACACPSRSTAEQTWSVFSGLFHWALKLINFPSSFQCRFQCTAHTWAAQGQNHYEMSCSCLQNPVLIRRYLPPGQEVPCWLCVLNMLCCRTTGCFWADCPGHNSEPGWWGFDWALGCAHSKRKSLDKYSKFSSGLSGVSSWGGWKKWQKAF